MKKRLISAVIVIAMLFSCVSCAVDPMRGSEDTTDGVSAGTDNGDGNKETEDSKNPENNPSSDKVTVILKNSDGVVLSESEIISGSLINQPTMPAVEGYIFIGWFERLSDEAPFDFNTAITSDLELWAKWEGDKVPEIDITPEQINSEYQITQLDVDAVSGKVSATVRAKSDCKVLVRFVCEEVYFSDGYKTDKQYIEGCSAEGTVTVSAESENVEDVKITVDIVGTLPEHFVAEAVLLDSEGNEISEYSADIENTSRFKIFTEKTVDDFGENEKLLNFDSSKDNNFGVLADDVKMLTAASVKEIAVNEDGDVFYWITSPSEQISAGDKIYIRADDGAEALFKVASASTNEDGITAIPARADENSEYQLTDFYKFIKVDMGYAESDDTETNTVAQMNDKKTEDTLWDKVKKIFTPFSFEVGEDIAIDVEGTVSGESGIEYCRFIHDPNTFGEDYIYFELVYEIDIIVHVTITANVSADANVWAKDSGEEPVVKIPMPLFAGFSPKAEIKLAYGLEIAGIVSADVPVKAKLGVKYDSDYGKPTITKKSFAVSVIEDTITCDGEAEVTFGPKLELGWEFLTVFGVQAEIFGGIKFSASSEFPEIAYVIENKPMLKHQCYACIDGTVSWFIDVSLSMTVKMGKLFKWRPFSIPVAGDSKLIFNFYISRPTEDSKPTFGTGVCQNYTRALADIYPCFDDGHNFIEKQYKIYNASTGELLYSDTIYPSDHSGTYYYSDIVFPLSVILRLEKVCKCSVAHQEGEETYYTVETHKYSDTYPAIKTIIKTKDGEKVDALLAFSYAP